MDFLQPSILYAILKVLLKFAVLLYYVYTEVFKFASALDNCRGKCQPVKQKYLIPITTFLQTCFY